MNPFLTSGAVVLTIWLAGCIALHGHITLRKEPVK